MKMSEKTSRLLLILEAILIATPLTGLAMLASYSLIMNAFKFPQLLYVVALGILALVSLFAIGSGWRLFIVFVRGGVKEFQSQPFGWWAIILTGVLVFVISLVSNLLPPSLEYSTWWSFRLSFDGFVLCLPILIPLGHLALVGFLRKENP